MKTAKELYKISKEQAPLLVKNVLDGVKKHCITRCEEEANIGSTSYSIYLKQTRAFAKELLLEKGSCSLYSREHLYDTDKGIDTLSDNETQ